MQQRLCGRTCWTGRVAGGLQPCSCAHGKLPARCGSPVGAGACARRASHARRRAAQARVVRWRLFREACCPFEGNYVKDLLCLGRLLADSIIVDNSPHSCAQPPNPHPHLPAQGRRAPDAARRGPLLVCSTRCAVQGH